MKGINKFVKHVLAQGAFEGCYYKILDARGNALVFSWGSVESDGQRHLYGKLARNVDDLQSDYDCDWAMDANPETGESVYTEIMECEGQSKEDLAAAFNDIYVELIKWQDCQERK